MHHLAHVACSFQHAVASSLSVCFLELSQTPDMRAVDGSFGSTDDVGREPLFSKCAGREEAFAHLPVIFEARSSVMDTTRPLLCRHAWVSGEDS